MTILFWLSGRSSCSTPPRTSQQIEPEVTAQELDSSELPDKESEEDMEQLSDDNDSLPPGVVFVMNLPDEMADDQDGMNKIKVPLINLCACGLQSLLIYSMWVAQCMVEWLVCLTYNQQVMISNPSLTIYM